MKKCAIVLLLIVPLISIILIIQFRCFHNETKEEIVADVKDNEGYSANVQYTIKNTKGEYVEKTKLFYGKDVGARIDHENGEKEIYKNGTINIFNGKDEYKIDEDFDVLYSLGFINNLLEQKIISIYEKQEEWGDTEYLEIDISLQTKNDHIKKVKTYINKKDKTPILTKVFDKNGQETVEILYTDFQYLDEAEKKLFKM